MPEAVLVAGGAGYIGSHAAKLLHQRGFHPVVVDNLVCGHRSAARWGTFVEADLADRDQIQAVLLEHRIRAVMHFAAHAYVGESVRDPAKYYRNNVANTLSLLEAMQAVESDLFLFSSSCATYGEPREVPIAEDHPQSPINPYGRTKLVVEGMLRDFETAYGMRHVSLRYFNAAGADPDGELGEDHDPETHLIPLVLEVARGARPHIAVFGTDYPTPDGTCVRDYIHVSDLAEAHVLALEHLLAGGESRSYNLGNGAGYSVRQVIEGARRLTGHPIPALEARRRWGDPATLVGSSEKIRRELGWTPQLPGLDTILETAWRWENGKRRAAGPLGR
ncbi:MAG: UDP-glucose 4-epimerase GalE [Deltaproteobacteria bacterium]|nr:UDP-glucose 4-epimerase GalE [Deltaproteobacteria bacterium]